MLHGSLDPRQAAVIAAAVDAIPADLHKADSADYQQNDTDYQQNDTDDQRAEPGDQQAEPGADALRPGEVGRIVDAFYEFHRTRAGFKAVWFGGHLSPDLLAVAFQCGSDIALSSAPLIEMIAPDVPAERRALVARVATEIVGAMLIVSSIETRPGFSEAFIAEAKIACVAYLERALGLPR